MIYEAGRIIYDSKVAEDAIKLSEDIMEILSLDLSTEENLEKLRELNPDKVLVLDTVELALGWLTFAKEEDKNKVIGYRRVVELLVFYLAGVEKV